MDHYIGDTMHQKIVIVLDCGATNIRAMAVNEKGDIIASHSQQNKTKADPFYSPGLIWDIEDIWQKFVQCLQAVRKKIHFDDVEAITVTTFGVNGAPVDSNGKLLYPAISWQCQRTVSIMDGINKYLPVQKLYEISGVNEFSFNTINVLIWLKENQPQVIDQMHSFLFMPSLIIHRLTGRMINDYTMVGTSMLADIQRRCLSATILNAIGIPNRFAEIGEAGTIAGNLTKKAANDLGFSKCIPVMLAGHDTQFALIGAGAGKNEAVLSSGTWEILMTRTRSVNLNQDQRQAGVTNELDAVPGLVNTGIQWLGSGILEWIKQNFYSNELNKSPDKIYETMVKEAQQIDPEAHHVDINLNFATNEGSISGLGLNTSRGEIYRTALLVLAEKTRHSLDILLKAGQFLADSLIVAGGGTKNRLWNQLRANALGLPLKLVRQSETTVIGAAAFAFVALGVFRSLDEALDALDRKYDDVFPNPQ